MEALLLILFISGLFGYLIISFFDFPKERIEHLIWLNVIFAILYAYNKKNAGLWNVEINFGKPIFTFLTICTFFILVIGLLRLKGEYYTKKLYDYKRNNNVQEIVKAGKAAWSFAYTIDPTSIPLDWYIGNANASMANYMDAQKSFLKAYSYNPFNRNVLNDLASSYVFNQQTERAILLYEEAARISPRFDDAKLNLVALYIANSDFKKAQFWLSSLLHDSERRTRYQKTVDFMLGVKTNTAIN